MSKAKEFERLIERIYELLVDKGVKVKWNERIPDPDNPKQSRHIDITIRRDEIVTHVECRSHKAPQGTKWIEELIGRQISLQADMVIAVSDSGFSEGAILKANKYGIVLRDLKGLSETEVVEWGKKSKLKLVYYGFKNIDIRLLFKNHNNIGLLAAASDLNKNYEYVDGLFNTLKYYLNQQIDFNYPLSIFYNIQAHNMLLCGRKLKGIKIRTEVHVIEIELSIPVVSVYGSPNIRPLKRTIAVEKADDFELEIMKSNHLVSLTLNLSNLPQAPANSVIAGIIKMDFGQPTTAPKFNLTGTQEQKMNLADVDLGLMEFEKWCA